MNRNQTKVKPPVKIQERERARLDRVSEEKQPGRASDPAVAWYLRMRLEQIIDVEQSATQAEVADAAKVPRSALSNIYLHSKGAGFGTLAPMATYLGFKTRGALMDEADRWWSTAEATEFVLERAGARERAALPTKKARRKSA